MSNDSHMSNVKRCPTAIFLHLSPAFPRLPLLVSTYVSCWQSFTNNKLLLQWQFDPLSQSGIFYASVTFPFPLFRVCEIHISRGTDQCEITFRFFGIRR